MNERIRQLALQAEFYSFAAGELQSPFRDEEDISDLLEKFAQLIVKDCRVALNPMLRDMISRGHAFDLIEKHFGVNE